MNSDSVAEELVKNFANDRLRPSMFVMVKYCVDQVGEDKNKIIEMLKSMVSDEEMLGKVAGSSFISKQLLKPFVSLAMADRETAINVLIETINNHSSEQGSNNQNEATKKVFATKNSEIWLKLSSLYKSIDKAEFDFYAEYDSNLNIAVKVSSVSIFDKDADMRVIEDLANYGVGYVAKVDTNLVVVGEPQFGKQRKIRNFSNGLQRVIKQESTTCVYEGEHRIFKVSLLVIDGEGFHNRQYHILLIQSCSKEKYSQYEGIMNSNIQSSIEHKADNSEKIYEFEDKDIGKIALRIDEDRYEATISDIGINLGEFKGADLVFEYEDDCSSLDEFIKCIDSFVKSFKYALKYRRKIMDALYKEAKEIYDIWLEGWYTPEQITPEFVKKHTSITCISVQKNSVSLSADYYDDNSENEDRDLGGHGFDIWLDQDDFKNNCDNIAWSLNG